MSVDRDHIRKLLAGIERTLGSVVDAPDDPRSVTRIRDADGFRRRATERAAALGPAGVDLASTISIRFGTGEVDGHRCAFEAAKAITGAERARWARSIIEDAQDCATML